MIKKKKITNYQSRDNTMIFWLYRRESVNIKVFLYWFEAVLGLKNNYAGCVILGIYLEN